MTAWEIFPKPRTPDGWAPEMLCLMRHGDLTKAVYTKGN